MRLISTLEEDMHGAAESLDFEGAARMRDQVVKLRAQIEHDLRGRGARGVQEGRAAGEQHGVRRKKR